MSSRFSRVGAFERARTESGWEFRPYADTARRVAISHAGCLTLLAVAALGACGSLAGAVVKHVLADSLGRDWSVAAGGVACGLTFLGSTPLLAAWARHVYGKSLRDNGLTMRVSPGGPVRLGDRTPVEAGRARHVVVRAVAG